MTKSEAKAIERRARRAYRSITAEPSSDGPAIPMTWLRDPPSKEIGEAIALIRDELWAILEMATAELG